MRITAINGFLNWPLKISCNKCRISLEGSLPDDFRIRRELEGHLIGDTPAYTVKRTKVTIQCPICGTIHEVEKDRIPRLILGKIPFEDIMPF